MKMERGVNGKSRYKAKGFAMILILNNYIDGDSISFAILRLLHVCNVGKSK
jgi:hypothetical protein